MAILLRMSFVRRGRTRVPIQFYTLLAIKKWFVLIVLTKSQPSLAPELILRQHALSITSKSYHSLFAVSRQIPPANQYTLCLSVYCVLVLTCFPIIWREWDINAMVFHSFDAFLLIKDSFCCENPKSRGLFTAHLDYSVMSRSSAHCYSHSFARATSLLST